MRTGWRSVTLSGSGQCSAQQPSDAGTGSRKGGKVRNSWRLGLHFVRVKSDGIANAEILGAETVLNGLDFAANVPG